MKNIIHISILTLTLLIGTNLAMAGKGPRSRPIMASKSAPTVSQTLTTNTAGKGAARTAHVVAGHKEAKTVFSQTLNEYRGQQITRKPRHHASPIRIAR